MRLPIRADVPRLRRSAALWRSAATLALGLPHRPPTAADRTRRSATPSSYEAPMAAANGPQFGRAYWLPPFGRGNGLEALFWSPVAQVPEAGLDAVLDALADEDIPAWAAPARGPHPASPTRPHHLSVGSAQLDAAQDVLMRVLRR